MALEITIYNRQKLVSKSGKEYVGYAIAFTPGQRGAIPAACEVPPFYTREQRSGDTTWFRMQARTLAEAKIEALQVQAVREAEAKGIEVVTDLNENKDRLTVRIGHYINEIEANKSHETWRAYNRSLEMFKESCKKQNVGDVSRTDLLHFKTFLKTKEFSGRSLYNHFLNVTVFFASVKGRNSLGLKKADWPPKPEREPQEYHREELEKMLKAANKDERLLLNAFLNSGFRNGEIAHLTYGDIDVRNSLWRVTPKDGHDLKHDLKNKNAQRVVPVGEWLTKKVMEKKEALKRKDTDLVFPAPNGGVDKHLIKIVKRVAKKAGVTGRVDVHKFRSTAITTWLRNGSTLFDVKKYVGHEDTEMLERYAAKLNLEKAENRRKVTAPFDQYATTGD